MRLFWSNVNGPAELRRCNHAASTCPLRASSAAADDVDVRSRCLAFTSEQSAADWLRSAVRHPDDMLVLRQVAAEETRPVAWLSDHQVVDHVARQVLSRRLCLVVTERRQREVSAPAAAPAARPFVTPSQSARKDDVKTWIEIALVDDHGKPVPGRRYVIKSPDGVKHSGALDSNGRARVSGIDPGSCDISFPDIDARECKPA